MAKAVGRLAKAGRLAKEEDSSARQGMCGQGQKRAGTKEFNCATFLAKEKRLLNNWMTPCFQKMTIRLMYWNRCL
jgi:hypothetical protein